ncbi:hypothetical protein BL253_04285 [Pseudofrankia asymbiotica]|uniref:Uncharacterized protein n=1 Tax=Pseudofrankia asymbiotica TaxID=1834516 RepID=A0A1V2IIU9_9ACTN|nr:hypothetical protein BL253_04285 [Pseudofrankia asymbiotica]
MSPTAARARITGSQADARPGWCTGNQRRRVTDALATPIRRLTGQIGAGILDDPVITPGMWDG